MITVITPFQRIENLELLIPVIKDKANWVVLIDNPELKDKFPEWITVKLYDKPREGICKPNSLLNQYFGSIKTGDETQYMILCDDDSVEEGFFDKIPNEDVVCVSMKRGYDTLIADPKNMHIAGVGGEQVIIKGKILRNFRYGLSVVGDGEMIEKVVQENKVIYVPDAYVLFNYLVGYPYSTFRRKPVVLFVGDYFCAGRPQMGLSEWEGNIWASLESTGIVEVARFHFDKYYYHTGQRGDQALIERIDEMKPDYIVAIIYKTLGSDPAIMHESTLKVINLLGVPIITIWGDLEAIEQRSLAKTVEPYCFKMVGTANKSVVEEMGYTYMHVPKDPRIFNNPNKKRDIDIVFSGSYGIGREERQATLIHLINNDIGLVHGGSEGRDHFTTEEYADRYKRSKMALSFSVARGMNVVNARPFEVLSCGAMLLEQESPELAKLFTPGVDYVEWKNNDDLLKKVRYYLEHEDERETIARNGQKKLEELYSAKTFWQTILKNANEK